MSRKGLKATLLSLPAALVAVSCSSNKPQPKSAAKAEIQGFQADAIAGVVRFIETDNQGTRIEGEIIGLMPNQEYAIHVHEMGNCANPEAAGPHFDPAGSGRHGQPGGSPDTHHAGDLPNIRTDDEGKARIDASSPLLGVGASQYSVQGRSIVLHSEPDDFISQPAGATGERIACGVIQPDEG